MSIFGTILLLSRCFHAALMSCSIQTLTCDTGLAGSGTPPWSGRRTRWQWTLTAAPAGGGPQRKPNSVWGKRGRTEPPKFSVTTHTHTGKSVDDNRPLWYGWPFGFTPSPYTLTHAHSQTHTCSCSSLTMSAIVSASAQWHGNLI